MFEWTEKLYELRICVANCIRKLGKKNISFSIHAHVGYFKAMQGRGPLRILA